MKQTSVSAVLFLFLAIALAGCLDDAGDVAPTTSAPMIRPAPEVVSQLEANACPPTGVPVQTATLSERFVVAEGFDEIVIEYGETGEGLVTPSIRYVEENKFVWGNEQRQVNTIAQGVACGAHGNHGPGETILVEPGEYEARIQYTGTVDIVLTVTARVSGGNDTMHADH
jgi:hypothetical protein